MLVKTGHLAKVATEHSLTEVGKELRANFEKAGFRDFVTKEFPKVCEELLVKKEPLGFRSL